MEMRIGLFGAASNWEPHAEELARAVGQALATRSVTIVTGATAGLPLIAAKVALAGGATVLGISPGKNAAEHVDVYKRPLEGFSQVVYTGMGFPLRNVLNAFNADGAIILGGELGTLQELCISICEKKVIGVLENSGGISSIVKQVLGACKKDYGAEVFFDTDPKALVESVIRAVSARLG